MEPYDIDTPDYVKINNYDDIAQWVGRFRWFSVYRLILGDFDLNGFENAINYEILMWFFVLITGLISVIGLNTVIAILADS